MSLSRMISAGVLLSESFGAAMLAPKVSAQTESASASAGRQQEANYPLEKIVPLTCRQAWQLGGRNRDGFFAIVKELAELSAQNRGVTLPDDKAAGARAGEWIRTQAIKDPDQLLYAVVDHAVMYSISKGRTTPAAGSGTHAATTPK